MIFGAINKLQWESGSFDSGLTVVQVFFRWVIQLFPTAFGHCPDQSCPSRKWSGPVRDICHSDLPNWCLDQKDKSKLLSSTNLFTYWCLDGGKPFFSRPLTQTYADYSLTRHLPSSFWGASSSSSSNSWLSWSGFLSSQPPQTNLQKKHNYPPVIKHGNGKVPIKPPFIGDFPLPCLITGG